MAKTASSLARTAQGAVLGRLRGRLALDGRLADGLVVAVLLVLVELELALQDGGRHRAVAAVTAALAVLCLLGRRRAAVVACTAALALTFLTLGLLGDSGSQLGLVVALVVTAWSAGAHADRHGIAWVAVATVEMLVAVAIVNPSDIIFPALFFVFLPWLGGRGLRGHRLLVRELAQETMRAELLRAEDRDRAIVRERARIARELHDVLAHDLSAMVVQASAAQRILDRDPDVAIHAAGQIAHTGREALSELRYLFGAVHRTDGDPLDGPPSLARVDELVRSATDAGLPATLTVEGEATELPSGMELAAFRVVQEALTNARKHAGPARADVTIRYRPGEVVLEITDDGAGAAVDPGLHAVGGGHGLVGMRERVGLYGGELHAGPAPGGGFAVRARLPTPALAGAR